MHRYVSTYLTHEIGARLDEIGDGTGEVPGACDEGTFEVSGCAWGEVTGTGWKEIKWR